MVRNATRASVSPGGTAQVAPPNPLELFLRDCLNSVSRERMFYNRLYYDLKLAAARRDYAITLYEPEVDRDGFDIVLDDGDTTRFVQLKTVLTSAKTATWDIAKRFLQPDLAYCKDLGIAPGDCGKGGAVVLIYIEINGDEAEVSYRVTDYFIMRMLSSGMVTSSAKRLVLGKRAEIVHNIWRSLHHGSGRDSVALPKGCFVWAAGTDQLLSLLSLHSTIHCHPIPDRFLAASKAGFRVDAAGVIDSRTTPAALNFAKAAASEFLTVTGDRNLAKHPNL